MELYLHGQTSSTSHYYALSSGAIFNDLERLQTQMSRLRHDLTLNVSETV